MNLDLTLPDRDDARVIWVFTAALDASAFQAFAKVGDAGWPLADALGLKGLSPVSVETFLAGDLADYGLERYLTEAHGMDPATVAPDAARLAAITGPVVLVFSRKLPEGATKLDPAAPLTFIGRYDAPYSLLPAAPTVPHESTRGHLSGPEGPAPDPGMMRWPLLITLAVMIALAVLVVALA